MSKKAILVSFSLLFIWGCTSSLRFTNTGYTTHFDDSVISLMPLTKDALIVLDKNLIYSAYKKGDRSKEEMILDTLYKYINNVLLDSIKKVPVVSINSSACNNWVQDDERFVTESKKVGADSVQMFFRVPKKEVVNELSSQTNIIIMINKITFSKVKSGTKFTGNVATGNFTGFSPPIADAKVQYVIWDYSRNQIISCGEFSTQGAFMAINERTLRTFFGYIGQELASATPFKIKKMSKF
jgi:hypothetical protein